MSVYSKLLFWVFILSTPIWVRGQYSHIGQFVSNTDVYKTEILNATFINSRALEYSPIYYGDGIIFVSSRSKGLSVKDKNINENFFDLYYAPFNAQGMPHDARLFSNAISSVYHEGSATLNQAQDVIYFSRNSQLEEPPSKWRRQKTENVHMIYEARKGPKGWSNIRALEFNSENYTTVMPALSPDNNRLYFASNMPGGYGGMDLYYVERIGNGWSAPVNLGPTINTAQNELFPFVAHNGQLYFASNGHPGFGGLDLFVSQPNGNTWSKPENLGEPINSKADDFGLCLAPNGFEGFFSSARPGGKGKDDIYRIRISLKDELPYVQAQMVFINEHTNRRLEGVELRIYELLPNGSLSAECPYYIYLDDNGEVGYNRKERAAQDQPTHISDINGTALPQLYKRKQYLLVADKEGYKTSFTQTSGDISALRLYMVEEEKPDCHAYRGVIISKLDYTAMSKVDVKLQNLTDQSIVTRTSDIEGYFSFCLAPDTDYQLIIESHGYISINKDINSDELSDIKDKEVKFVLEPFDKVEEEDLKEGNVIVLNHIYYEYNSTTLTDEAMEELEELADVMKAYPSMEIELISHTDSRGDWSYNQSLSLERAQSAKRYLVSRGIDKSRIDALGYGESQIRNHCLDGVECTEEEHAFNRRTEVRIIKFNAEKDVEIIKADN